MRTLSLGELTHPSIFPPTPPPRSLTLPHIYPERIGWRANASTCAIIGGVLTVASLVDSAIFNSRKRLGKEHDSSQYGGISGKMVSVGRLRWLGRELEW